MLFCRFNQYILAKRIVIWISNIKQYKLIIKVASISGCVGFPINIQK